MTAVRARVRITQGRAAACTTRPWNALAGAESWVAREPEWRAALGTRHGAVRIDLSSVRASTAKNLASESAMLSVPSSPRKSELCMS